MLVGLVTRKLMLNRLITGVLTLAGSAQRLSQNLFSRTKSSILSTSGLVTRRLDSIRGYSSSISLSGAYSYVKTGAQSFASSYSGLVSLSGAYSYIRTGSQRLYTGATSGTLWLIGSLYRGWLWGTVTRIVERFRASGGGLSLEGALSYALAELSVKLYSGTMAVSGSLLRYVSRIGAGSGIQSFSGLVTKLQSLFRTQSSSLNSSGTIKRTALVSHLYDGALNLSGDVYMGLYFTYSSALSFAGTVSAAAKVAVYQAVGDLSTAASVTRSSILARAKDGLLTITGLVSGVKYSGVQNYWVSVAGSITPSAVIEGVRNLVTIVVQGTLSPIGRLTLIDFRLDRISAAALVSSGSILRRIITARTKLTSALTLSGIVARLSQFNRQTMAGVISFAGVVTNATTGGVWNYSASGIASLTGALTRLYAALRTYVGGLSFGGVIRHAKEMGRTISSALTFSGQSIGLFTDRDWRLGFLALSGVAVPYLVSYRPTYSSTLNIAGVVSGYKTITRVLKGSITPSAKNPERCKDFLYFGPPNP